VIPVFRMFWVSAFTGFDGPALMIADVGPDAVDPLRVSVYAVNCPPAGSDKVRVVETGVSEPWAQLGTQPWILDVPVPVAPVAVHDAQVIEVTTFPASPLKSM
jgi:hypothetical protein